MLSKRRGQEDAVEEVSVFHTVLRTPDNVKVIVPDFRDDGRLHQELLGLRAPPGWPTWSWGSATTKTSVSSAPF